MFPLKLTVWWQVDALQVYRNVITIFYACKMYF